MVQQISSVTPTPPAPAATADPRPAPPQGAAAQPAPASQVQAKSPAAPLLSVGVERADNGVFVYTLRDTESGKLLVIIPRVQLEAGAKVQTQA